MGARFTRVYSVNDKNNSRLLVVDCRHQLCGGRAMTQRHEHIPSAVSKELYKSSCTRIYQHENVSTVSCISVHARSSKHVCSQFQQVNGSSMERERNTAQQHVVWPHALGGLTSIRIIAIFHVYFMYCMMFMKSTNDSR